jgi:hypothetical protein
MIVTRFIKQQMQESGDLEGRELGNEKESEKKKSKNRKTKTNFMFFFSF